MWRVRASKQKLWNSKKERVSNVESKSEQTEAME